MLIFIYGQNIRQGHFGFLNKFDLKEEWKTFQSSTDRIAKINFQYDGLLGTFFQDNLLLFVNQGGGQKYPRNF